MEQVTTIDDVREGNVAPPGGRPLSSLDEDGMERELAELTGHLDAAEHRQVTLIRMIDESGRWARQGAKTCAQWLSWRVKMDIGTAREKLRVGHALVKLPRIDDAFRTAQLSYSQVRAMTRVASPDNEERLLELASCSTASQLERICRGVRQVLRAEGDHGASDGTIDRWVRIRPMGDGTSRVEAQLTVDEAARVMDAVRSVRGTMDGDDARSTLADALVRLIERVRSEAEERSASTRRAGFHEATYEGDRVAPARRGGGPDQEAADDELRARSADRASAIDGQAAGDVDRSSAASRKVTPETLERVDAPEPAAGGVSRRPPRRKGGDLTTLVVHLAPDVLERGHAVVLDDGTRLHAETFRRIACDCGLIPVQTDKGGEPLDVGRKTRSIPPALRRAITLRDGGACRFPGCTHTRFLHAHHIEHWVDGGETNKDNLILLCSFHHQLVHEGGWAVRFDGRRDPVVRRPTGERHPATFPRKRVELDEARAFVEAGHEDVPIDEETARSGWGGETPDMAMCVHAALWREAGDTPAADWLRSQGYGRDDCGRQEPAGVRTARVRAVAAHPSRDGLPPGVMSWYTRWAARCAR